MLQRQLMIACKNAWAIKSLISGSVSTTTYSSNTFEETPLCGAQQSRLSPLLALRAFKSRACQQPRTSSICMRPQNVSEVQKSIRLGFLITFHATLKDYVACDNTFEQTATNSRSLFCSMYYSLNLNSSRFDEEVESLLKSFISFHFDSLQNTLQNFLL